MTGQTQVIATTIPSLPNEVWYGWLDRFRAWVEPTTEGAREAIFGVGSVELGLAIGRKTAIHYGRPTHANLYVAVIGLTGVPKKSTIVSRGHDLRSKAFPPDAIRTSRSIGSGEGLLERFCEEAIDPVTKRTILKPIPGQRVLLDEPELTNLLKKARRPGTANLTEILLALFDGDDFSPNTRSRPMRVEGPFFSLVTTTTPESLEMALEDIDIDSGLIPRFATFFCTPRPPMAYPPLPDDAEASSLAQELRDITNHAAHVGATHGVCTLSPQARAEWETVYHDFTEATRKAPQPVAAIMARVPTMVMKWSLLYAMQAGHGSIDVDDLARGVLVGTYLMETARLVPRHTLKSLVARVEQKIIDALTRARGQWLTASEVHRLVGGRIKAEELRRSLRSLVELGVIEAGPSLGGRAKAYRVP